MKEYKTWTCDCWNSPEECECYETESNAIDVPFTVTEKQLTERDLENMVSELNNKISDLTNGKRWCKYIIK